MNNTINYKGKTIHFESAGQGSAVVLLHGFLESSQIWKAFAEDLSKEYRVVTVDFPGHGRSQIIGEVHSMEMMAETVKFVLDKLEITENVIVGHSMGGYVSLAFAQMYPDFIKGIGLFHSQASADSDETKENRRRTINIVRRNRIGFISSFIPDLFAEANIPKFQDEIDLLKKHASEISPEGIIAAIEGMKQRSSKLDLLMQAKIPFLFIAGKEDSRIPVQNVMAQAILPELAEVLILSNVGHMGFIEAKTETLQMIKGFLNQVYK